jgi:hypothetical protein
MNFKENGCENFYQINLAHCWVQWSNSVKTVMNLRILLKKKENFFFSRAVTSFSIRTLLHGDGTWEGGFMVSI